MKKIIYCFVLLAFVAFKSYGQSPIAVSEKGFLKFTSNEEFEEYGNWLSKSNHAEVKKFHESINFVSRGKIKYDDKYDSESVTDEQQIDYALSADGIVEMNGVIMKPVEENKFLITITIENLNGISYEHLAKGEYDKESMNKFATNRPKEARIDLFEFIKQTPKGYEETQSYPESARKFWGKECIKHTVCIPNAETGGCDNHSGTECCKYRFWINTSCEWVRD